jgi:hypothetical protein
MQWAYAARTERGTSDLADGERRPSLQRSVVAQAAASASSYSRGGSGLNGSCMTSAAVAAACPPATRTPPTLVAASGAFTFGRGDQMRASIIIEHHVDRDL